MMLNESFEKNVRPRNPEKMYTSEPMPCSFSTQSAAPMLYSAGEYRGDNSRQVEFLPAETVAMPISECVMILLLQFVPVLSIILDAVWSFSPNTWTMKRILSRSLLIVQCIVTFVAALAWLIH